MEAQSHIATELAEKGYAVMTGILSKEDIKYAKGQFYEWKKDIDDALHSKIDPHGIYKHQEVGHQRHAWYLRTHPSVKNVFEQLWKKKLSNIARDAGGGGAGGILASPPQFWQIS